MKKLKNIDYIFQVHNIDNKSDINKILIALREIECVTAAFLIGSDTYGKEKNLQYINR